MKHLITLSSLSTVLACAAFGSASSHADPSVPANTVTIVGKGIYSTIGQAAQAAGNGSGPPSLQAPPMACRSRRPGNT